MALPFYVSPEQMMQDRAEYAKKGIAKGRSILALTYNDGVLFVADNPSTSLFKISEIYDCIAFSGAGRYSEFENLRKAGIQHADVKGMMYSREDVSARSLANGYSQILGTIFSQEMKPYEVELLLAQVGETSDDTELYRITFDGSIIDERQATAIGGRSEAILTFIRQEISDRIPTLKEALSLCQQAFERGGEPKPNLEGLEIALLDRHRPGRKFRRVLKTEASELLAS